MTKKLGGKLALGALVIAGLGYIAGILTAPKSGRETRKDIQRRARKARLESEAKLKDLHSSLTTLINRCKKQAVSMSRDSHQKLNSAIEKAQIAKDKARELLSAAHEGEADDQDLQAAIDQARKAAKNLKTFVSKNATKSKK